MTPQEVLKPCKDATSSSSTSASWTSPACGSTRRCPISELTLDSFEHGFGFDGSSIRGWQAINEIDMLLIPVADTAKIDPFMQHTTLSIICDVRDPITKKEYSRDPRSIARKAVDVPARSRRSPTRAYFGPELEFFVFDQAFYDQGINFAKYYVGSREGIWGRGDEDATNLRLQDPPEGGLLPDAADGHDAEHPQRDGRDAGGPRHPGRGAPPRGGDRRAVRDRHALPGPACTMADSVMMYKYVCKNVAARHGKVVTFMPKPLFQDNGSGHARALLAVEGRQAAVRGEQVRGAERHGAVRDRRDPEARQGAVRDHQPDDQQLQAARARVRGAGEPRLQQPQPLGRDPHPDVQRQPQDQAHRVPLPGQQSATRTSRSARSRWPRSTGSRTRSTPATRWTRTSTT